jgi:hypothetical protein
MDLNITASKLTDPTEFGSKKNNESRKVQVVLLGLTVPDYPCILILVLFNLKMFFGVAFNFFFCVS